MRTCRICALVPKSELDRVRGATDADPDARLALLADMCRLNTLVAIKRAGSGHLGSSFSALDIVVHLLYEELNVAELGFDHPERDVFFSSKGHDVPGLYAALYGLGVFPQEQLLRLRRLGGLDGHPDVGIPGIEANSGSLGMGISKGRGIAWAKWSLGFGGRVVVMTGDGELQEGQNWEALQAAAHERLGTLWVVVDRNELQSDKPTEEIVALGDLEGKLRAFGWDVRTCDGHDHAALREAFARVQRGRRPPERARCADGEGEGRLVHGALGRPRRRRRVLHVARGRSRRRGLRARTGRARREDRRTGSKSSASARSSSYRSRGRRGTCATRSRASPRAAPGLRSTRSRRSTSSRRTGRRSSSSAASNDRLVVLDADLASDCRVRGFELAFPDRFVECGIAEQDMVSTAAGLARHGFLPVVNSFASFLASRANEQIYNQASEGSKVVYALHYAGLIPAGPGKSHQSVRDISLLGALPNMTIVQPGTSEETRALLRWAIEDAEGNVAIRLAIGPSPRHIELPAGYELTVGRGSRLQEGEDAVLLAYGPVLLHEALLASERLAERGNPARRREHALAQPRRPGLAHRGDRPVRAHPRARRPRARGRRSATRCAALSTIVRSPSTGSRAGPRAAHRRRPSASTSSTAPRSRGESRRGSACAQAR